MLTAEIKVNGKLLGHLYIVNKGLCWTGDCGTDFRLPARKEGEHYYEYEYFEIGSNEVPKVGIVKHKREDGALTLIRICAEDMGL